MPKCALCGEDHEANDDTPMFVHSKCHPGNLLGVSIEKDTILTLYCGAGSCQKPIARFHVEALPELGDGRETTH